MRCWALQLVTACLIFRVTAGIPYTVEIHTIFKICHIYSTIYLAIIASTSQFAACHTGSLGCFDLSALSPRNRHCQTRCLCSITFLHSCCSTVYFTLLDQNVSVDRLWSWSKSSRMDHNRLFKVIDLDIFSEICIKKLTILTTLLFTLQQSYIA